MLRKSDITCYKDSGYNVCICMIVFFTTLFGRSNIENDTYLGVVQLDEITDNIERH